MMNVINSNILSRILADNSENNIESWSQFLSKVECSAGDYRELLKTEFTLAGRNVLNKDVEEYNHRRHMYLDLLMKLNSLKVVCRMNNGELEVAICQETDEEDT